MDSIDDSRHSGGIVISGEELCDSEQQINAKCSENKPIDDGKQKMNLGISPGWKKFYERRKYSRKAEGKAFNNRIKIG